MSADNIYSNVLIMNRQALVVCLLACMCTRLGEGNVAWLTALCTQLEEGGGALCVPDGCVYAAGGGALIDFPLH